MSSLVGKKAFCHLPNIPQRSEPKESSEMVNQLIFGECYEILEELNNWIKIKVLNYNYEGWIDKKLQYKISDENCLEWQEAQKIILKDQCLVTVNGYQFMLNAGSILPTVALSFVSLEYTLGEPQSIDLRDVYKPWLGTPYLWGGKNMMGVDCSGFSQLIYRIWGIDIERDASKQALQGEKVNEAQFGDLAFFENEKKKITHVGICLSSKEIVHASGIVRIDYLTPEGIKHLENKNITHKLSHITRFTLPI